MNGTLFLHEISSENLKIVFGPKSLKNELFFSKLLGSKNE
jgi:hypothetical protein